MIVLAASAIKHCGVAVHSYSLNGASACLDAYHVVAVVIHNTSVA